MSREDTYTSTVDGARGFEYQRDGRDYGDRDDRPSSAEVGEALADTRSALERQAREDAVARAAGRYVPSPRMRFAVALLRWSYPGAIASREGVAWIPTVKYADVAAALSADLYDVAPAGEHGYDVYVRIRSMFEPDPWATP